MVAQREEWESLNQMLLLQNSIPGRPHDISLCSQPHA